MNRSLLVCVFGLAALGGGCAAVPSDPVARSEFEAANDPLEPLNRRTFAFNEFIDRHLFRPVVKAYVRVVPRPGRDAIRNFVSNLNEPVVFANNVLQGQLRRAGTTASRFVLDTTLGVAGLMDFGKEHGLPKQTGDLGQTFYAWGVRGGPYLVLPVFGPSNPRDATGLVVSYYFDPYRYVVERNKVPTAVAYGPPILGGIDERARAGDALDAIRGDAVDYYASLRSFFRQNRDAQLRGNTPITPTGTEGIYDDPGESPALKPPK